MSLARRRRASHTRVVTVPYLTVRRSLAGLAASCGALFVTMTPATAGAQAGTRGGVAAGGRSAGRLAGDQPGDSAAVARAVTRFHEALASGDSTAALALLAPDVTILESGGVETRDEYRGHHLPGDIGFARAVRSVRGPIQVRVRGEVAWATSSSTTQGEYRGRAVNSAGAELMVLTRDGADWRISAIHWSSRTRRP